MLFRSMRALEKQVKVLDKAVEQQFEIIPNTLTSIPGIGKVYSAGIIAEIGDIHRFSSQAVYEYRVRMQAVGRKRRNNLRFIIPEYSNPVEPETEHESGGYRQLFAGFRANQPVGHCECKLSGYDRWKVLPTLSAFPR